MPKWIEKGINGYLARMLGMSRPESEPGTPKSQINLFIN